MRWPHKPQRQELSNHFCLSMRSNQMAACPTFQGSLGLDKTRETEEGPAGAEPTAGAAEMVGQPGLRVHTGPASASCHWRIRGSGSPPAASWDRVGGGGRLFFPQALLAPLPPPPSLTSHPPPPPNTSALTSGQTHNRRDCFYSTN